MSALAVPTLVATVAVLVLRWTAVDEVPLIALVALTPFLGVPLAVADLLAWSSGERSLRLLAAVVTAGYLATVSPLDAVVGCGPSQADEAITIMTANVLSGGGRAADFAAAVVAADPDVFVLQEVGWGFKTELEQNPVLSPWSHRSSDLRTDDDDEVLIWSRWPLDDVGFGNRRVNSVRAAVETAQGRFQIRAVHISAPTSGYDIEEWYDQLGYLADLPRHQPAVLAGDFNATEDHQPFRHLLNSGWTDVHDDKGCGMDQTWPARYLPFPVMRLDHVLVTDHFEVLSTELGDPAGSDHLPVVTRVRFRTEARPG